MLQSQIDYYSSLPEESRAILQMAAFKCNFTVNYEILNVINYYTGKNISQKKITIVIDDAVRQGLFDARYEWGMRYTVAKEFLVYVMPDIRFPQSLWGQSETNITLKINETSPLLLFRNCVYTLLHQPDKYEDNETRFIDSAGIHNVEYFSLLFENKAYEKYLPKIAQRIIFLLTVNDSTRAIMNLTPFQEIRRQIEHKAARTNYPELLVHSELPLQELYFQCKLDELLEKVDYGVNFKAIKYLIEGNLRESIASFKEHIDVMSFSGSKMLLPFDVYEAYFYVIALLLSGEQVYLPVFQKILQAENKGKNYSFYHSFVAIAFDAFNVPKGEWEDLILDAEAKIIIDKINYESLICIPILYLINEKGKDVFSARIHQVIKKAADGAYYLIAYEAAFVAKTWYNNKKFNDLYDEIACRMNHLPVISQVKRKEEWERTINLLLGMKSKSAGKSKDNNEISTRVVYYFNPKYNTIQPVLQTRNNKGWSKGRNIAITTFKNLAVKGMTEQDIRITKHVQLYESYYSKSYDFINTVFVELIGHPYIFLDNANNLPVEFVAAQIVVSINKTPKGYQLIADLQKITEKVMLVKETNTRYKVYNLTDNQIRILNIINRQEITVPESGKSKLTELLGTLSAEGMTVHSDLMTTDKNALVEIKEMPTDSRIRVQLLPFGDGLKTELFSKPFGDRPPYCKPGKGGKMLISNEKNTQLQVKRNLKQEADNEQLLINDIQSLESLNVNDNLMSFDNPLDSLTMLDMLANRQDICVVEWPEGEKYKLRGKAEINKLNIKITSGINWFDLQGELHVDEHTVLSLQQLLRLTAKSHGRYIELSPGDFLALSERLKKQLDNLRLFSSDDKKGLHLNKFATVGLGDFFEEIENLKADKTWKTFRQQLEKIHVENAPVPAVLRAELRTYQEEGFRWLAQLAEWNAGACLADDMGLGKTVQALAILLHRASIGAALVVCPVSVVNNWVSEAEKFAPTLRFKTLGISSSNRKETLQTLEAGDVLVTSYGLLQSEEKLFAEYEYATIVLDEAHVIKNYATKTSKATMQLKAGFRMALTGTPIQNHLGEIWNLFNFINPGLLGSLQHFTDTFVKSEDGRSKIHLKKMITPFILRRTKTAVLDELPPKTEIVKKIQLSDDETAFYEAIRRQALENLSNVDETKHLQVLAEIMKLRQASCNPRLIDPAINIPSSKLSAFLDIVDELIENKHRALVFSQFVTHLTIVRQALDKKDISYQYLDGSSSINERQRSVDNFQSGQGELFLISLKAGGLGMNLTAADYVIHLDPWWNPAVEDQASDRAHRIGQYRPVTIYRLVAEHTIEEKIIQLHHRKRDLAEQLLEGSDMSARLSVHEMVELIKENVSHVR